MSASRNMNPILAMLAAAMSHANNGGDPEVKTLLDQTMHMGQIAAGYEGWKTDKNEANDFEAEHTSFMPLANAVHNYHQWLHEQLGDLSEMTESSSDVVDAVEVSTSDPAFRNLEIGFEVDAAELSEEQRASLSAMGRELAKLGVTAVTIKRK